MRVKRAAIRGVVVSAIAAFAVSLAALPARAQSSTAPALDAPLATQTDPMTVVLDARKAPLGLAYTHMTIPVAPGPFTIDYPQWIPGEHSPDGPLQGMSELRVTANGAPYVGARSGRHVRLPPQHPGGRARD